ncbi:Foie gras liver health family 1-domain-containing protein [Kockovaella imperatae]|uniref:Foie gras liver health family 1-domain-containing protein n=1 Tax=Kockovaella imperatae TaxID=4999 RepID=A0A1Y1UPG5_9TREE|nr:Foie gras liver health family 1-domain-containing protein [Kockovaella imperatae]ORX39862.1 Foie gras liver health family 1-domain-containing protein [Kockovaella imperatae]
MNSYPSEFLCHPQPLMFVAGLLDPSTSLSTTTITIPTNTRDRAASTSSAAGPSSRRPSENDSFSSMMTSTTTLEPNTTSIELSPGSTPADTPATSSTSLPFSPPVQPEDAKETTVLDSSPQDKDFKRLLEDLRGALSGMQQKGKVWLPVKERKDFRIILVDKNVRLPIRKVSTTSTNDPQSSPRSPLSPLTPSSPLYPDGLIAPVWVRKHAELVPSVFVLFLRLYEAPDPSDPNARTTEQEMDNVLVGEIGDRRRRLGERGIKLTVVLMASTEALDSPNLDARLSYLRRASALSSKASLFVLTPVPADQLPDFVQSLQDALYDSAMEYYSNHMKRVRRKKARLPANQYGALLGADRGRALGSQGWGVRYDWKAGWFAEVKGETEVARRHYEDCWNELARMFASTQTLPPRTKRWAEAKVLADCVAVKICKLILYEGGGPKVLGPFFVHLKRFGDLSRGWGIGEDTFEFWSWIARQYRIFAELLEFAVQNGQQVSTFPPISPDMAMPELVPGKSGVNPLQILQPPAFYFYMAASCTLQRHERFLVAKAAEEDAMQSEAGAASGYVSAAPGYSNEKKVDHAGLTVELLTKAYTLVLAQTPPQIRIAAYLAFRIAETHVRAGQYDSAMKYFDELSLQDQWEPIVKQTRALWYESAQRTGNVEAAARLLIEMICPGSGLPSSERSTLQDDLLSVLRTTAPANGPFSMTMPSESALLDVSAAFWTDEVQLPGSASYQFCLSCPESVDISSLSFDRLVLSFSDRPDVTIKSVPGVERPMTQVVDLASSEDTRAALRWSPGSRVIINGELDGLAGSVSISNVLLVLKEGPWEIDLQFRPPFPTQWHTAKGSIAPAHDLSSFVSFVTRPYDISMEVNHHPSAFVDESLPVLVRVTNKDDRRVEAKLSVFLQPAEEEDGSFITYLGETSKSLFEDLQLGTLQPGASIEKSITLQSPHPSTKIIDFSLHTIDSSNPSIWTSDNEDSIQETTYTAVIPVLPPFEMMTRIDTTPSLNGDPQAWTIVISAILTCPIPRRVYVHGISLAKGELEIVSSSLGKDTFPQAWDQVTSYAVYAKFQTTLPSLKPPAYLVCSWKSDEKAALIETRLPLPLLNPPSPGSGISARIAPPTVVHLNQPFSISVNLTNMHRTLASSLNIEISTGENFVWRGNRIIRLPDLLPEEKTTVDMELVAVGATGWCTLPKITIWEEDSSPGEAGTGLEVRLVDGRNGSEIREGLQVFVRP